MFLSPLHRLLRWVRRFRHRCGYGIHSPFAFGFVTGVVYERGEYYAYEDLRQYYREHRADSSLRLKDLLLLFRVANYQRPHRCWIAQGRGCEAVKHFMQHGSKHSHYELSPHPTTKADLLFMLTGWETQISALMEALAPGGLLIVGRTEGVSAEAWQAILAHPKAQVCFDLGDFGLAFFRPELQRQSYVVCYY